MIKVFRNASEEQINKWYEENPNAKVFAITDAVIQSQEPVWEPYQDDMTEEDEVKYRPVYEKELRTGETELKIKQEYEDIIVTSIHYKDTLGTK